MNSAVGPNFKLNFNENFAMNSAWDALILTQMQFKVSFNSIQTRAKCEIFCKTSMPNKKS